MYQGATADNECPLVVDTSTPSCGDSRFGCWTCTLVEKDKSMEAMINNDDDKVWMEPLLSSARSSTWNDRNCVTSDGWADMSRRFETQRGTSDLCQVPTPSAREKCGSSELLAAQTEVRAKGPAEVADLDLITMEELHEIRRIWVFEKHEIEDALPRIYQEGDGSGLPRPAA